MADSIADKLVDLLLGGVGSVADLIVPPHWRNQAKARLGDFNPFEIIKGNHDLVRAVRLSWIEAALEVLKAARGLRSMQDGEAADFVKLAEEVLIGVRHAAWDRRGHAGDSAIDAHVEAVMRGTAAFITPGGDPVLARPLTDGFVTTLASLTHWPPADLPKPLAQIARDGLPTVDGGARRDFGELVFAAFAELLKDPKKYPEAGPAFAIAMQEQTRALAQATLDRMRGVEARLDDLLARLDAGAIVQAGATQYLSLLPRVAAQVDTIEKKVDALPQAIVERLMAALDQRGVPLAALREQLARLGELDVPAERVQARIEAFVTGYLALKADLARATNADPEIARTHRRAVELLDAGDLDAARALFDGALTRLRERRQQAAREEATLLADRARIDMLQVRYATAIAAYEEAVDLTRFDPEAMLGHLESLSEALITSGYEFGDNAALHRAIDVIRTRSLPLAPRESAPLDWARLQGRLGNALRSLGERERGTGRLEEAVAAYRAALQEFKRERVPFDWARTQDNLGTALQRLGGRESGTERLEEAAAAYRAALQERTRERVPLDWARTQDNLGTALTNLGERESGTARLEEAVAACRAALQEWTRERVPLHWAATQTILGIALQRLGERESGTARLEEAVAAYRAALQEHTRERVPLNWATTQTNLGNALFRLGQRERGTARLEEAVAAHRAALQECTRERVPLHWAATQTGLGLALWRLGERESGTARLEEAVATYRAALQEWTRERVPLDWAMTLDNLGIALSSLGERERGTERLEEAVAAYRAALEERTRERVPLDWATTQNNLGNALLSLGERESGTARLEEAAAAFRAALQERTPERTPRYHGISQRNLDRALALLTQRRNH